MDLFMIVVSIVFYNPSHPLYPVPENRDRFWRLNFIQSSVIASSSCSGSSKVWPTSEVFT
jgi:hypothetical protein